MPHGRDADCRTPDPGTRPRSRDHRGAKRDAAQRLRRIRRVQPPEVRRRLAAHDRPRQPRDAAARLGSWRAVDVDLGPGPDGRPTAVYSRCTHDRQIATDGSLNAYGDDCRLVAVTLPDGVEGGTGVHLFEWRRAKVLRPRPAL
jgi:hypothetical protein